MTDLFHISDDELRAELAHREEAAKPPLPKPVPIEAVNWSAVYKTVVDGVDNMIALGYEDDDLDGYISDAAFDVIYGAEYWVWRRAQKW